MTIKTIFTTVQLPLSGRETFDVPVRRMNTKELNEFEESRKYVNSES